MNIENLIIGLKYLLIKILGSKLNNLNEKKTLKPCLKLALKNIF